MDIHLPESEQELIEYVERRLGYDRYFPDETNEIDLTENQKHDLVNAAIQMFQMYCYDGCKDIMIKLPLTTGKTEYKLPKSVYAVYNYMTWNEYSNMFSLDYQMKTYVGMNLNFFADQPLTYIEVTRQYLSLVDLKIGYKASFTFNSTTHTLNIIAGAKSGVTLCVLASAFIDEVPSIYSNNWILRYCEQLFLRQWANNFRQFDGVKLPSGITINWREMLGDANQRIKELEDELITFYSRPVRMRRG